VPFARLARCLGRVARMVAELIRVAVIFGGRSSEHAISCMSAGCVLEAIDRTKYEVIPIGITQAGNWVLQSGDSSWMKLIDEQLPQVPDGGDEALLSLDPSRRGVWINSGSGDWSWQPVDIVFPVLHGANGEDGSIQGLFELAGLPFVGSGVFASAACMDKGHTKTILAAANLPVGSWSPFQAEHWRTNRTSVVETVSGLGWPMFVKPARAGSSLGVSKAANDSALREAVERALEHDPRIVVEAAVENAREIECGVLGRSGGTVAASVCAEIKVREGHDFYDFEAKYLDDSVDLQVPAELTESEEDEIQGLAVRAFEALGCEGLARVDFFLTSSGDVIINEVNTMPGFTPISMYPSMWAKSGLPYDVLIDELIQEGITRGTGLR
jgi:D-alanine-D-alanine ligase